MKKTFIFLAFLFFVLITDGNAACTWSQSDTVGTAASHSQSDVADCIDDAECTDGDTIIMPAGDGTETWSSEVTIHDKSITVIGPGSDNLAITTVDGCEAFLLTSSVSGSNSSRISGFEIRTTGYAIKISPDEGGVPQGWRFDNMYFNTTSDRSYCIYGYGNSIGWPYGLIDNSDFYNCGVLLGGGYVGSAPSTTGGSYSWSQPLDLGTEKSVYIEDCTMNFSSYGWGATESNMGGRQVIRFSTVTNAYIGNHSQQGMDHRGTRSWQFYHNTINSDSPALRPFLIRAGTGVVFDNTLGDNWTNYRIDIDNVRSCEDRPYCDGDHFADGNTPGESGYPCRDQIGRSTDASLWDMSDPSPAQDLDPAYSWSNKYGETVVNFTTVYCAESQAHIQEDRDFYNEDTSFDGTSGVGVGTLANRPATCTTGVAYWATDQGGNWSSEGGANDGCLYECSSTDTWAVYYTPYAYPHPLQGASSCATTGTIVVGGVTEAEIVTGGETLILTLTGDTWVATVGADNGITDALMLGIDSGGVEGTGWDAEVRDNMVFGDVTRTSDSVVTITLGAEASYAITTNETITAIIPATALTGAAQIVASPTFEITAASDPAAALTGTLSDNATEAQIVNGGETIIITLTNDTWVATVGDDDTPTDDLMAKIDSAQSETTGWDAEVRDNMVYTDVTRDSDTQVTVLLGAEAAYDISANETITVTIPTTAVTSGTEYIATPAFAIIFFDTATEEIVGMTLQ